MVALRENSRARVWGAVPLALFLALLLALTVCLTGMAGTEEGTSRTSDQGDVSPVRRFFDSAAYKWGMSWLNFGIICFLVYRYARPPLVRFLDARAREVAETIERSTRTKQEAQAELREAIRRLAGVAHEKRRIVQLATEVGDKRRAAILEDAQRAAERVTEQLDADMERARYMARHRLVEQLVSQVVDEAEQRIVATITEEDHAALIERFIEQLDRSMVV